LKLAGFFNLNGEKMMKTKLIVAFVALAAFLAFCFASSPSAVRLVAAQDFNAWPRSANRVPKFVTATDASASLTMTNSTLGDDGTTFTVNSNKVSITEATGAATFAGAITPTAGVAAAGGLSVKANLAHTGGMPARVSTDGTDATPVATEVYIAQVFISANMSVTGVAVMNGSVASGNIKVGLADSTGAVVATSVSTAMSGTDAYQRIAFTAPFSAVGPATYYVLEFVDNNTARINCHTFGDFGASKQTGQTYATGFTTITPPTTFTTALGPIASLY
jgi:hypothetical protein